MNDALTVYRDFEVANDVGGNLLLLANCGWLRWGQAVGARWDLSIVAGSINVPAKTCTIRRKARSTTDAAKELTSHPWHNTTVAGVLLDGNTPYYGTLVPDTQLVFGDVGIGIVDTYTAHVTHGDYLGAFEDGNPSAPTPGQAVYQARLGVKNFGATIAKQVTIFANRPRRLFWVKTGTGIFEYFRISSTAPVARIVSNQIKPYRFLWSAPAGGGDGDLTMEGALITTVRRLSNNATQNSAGLLRGERYRIESGDLNGGVFKVRDATYGAQATAGDRANIVIWPAGAAEISADSGGAAVSFGLAAVALGDLAPSAGANFHLRAFANIGSGLWNPVPVGCSGRYLETGVADINQD